MTHADLVRRACEWLASSTMKMHAVVPELSTWGTREIPDVLGFRAEHRAWAGIANHTRVVVTLVECKVSRADFQADKGKPWRKTPALGMGELRWYFAPEGILRREDMPPGWGLAECRARGVRKVVLPRPHLQHNEAEAFALLVAAMRRVCCPSVEFPPVHHVHTTGVTHSWGPATCLGFEPRAPRCAAGGSR